MNETKAYYTMSASEYEEAKMWAMTYERPSPGEGEAYLTDILLNHNDCPLRIDSSIYWNPLLAPMYPIIRIRDGDVLVVYTECHDKLRRGLRTVGKPGKFISRLFKPAIPDRLIDSAVTWFRGKHLRAFAREFVEFAVTAKDIMAVYKNGPTSCMDEKVYNRIFDFHPCCTYAYPYDRTEIVPGSGNTLALAYMGSLEKPTARAIVDVANRKYARAYGLPELVELLDTLGYEKDQNFLGGQVLSAVRVSSSCGYYYLPYLDGGLSRVRFLSGDALLVTDDGPYCCSSSGTIRCGYDWRSDSTLADRTANYDGQLAPCEHCESEYPPGSLIKIYGGDMICPTCRYGHYENAVVAVVDGVKEWAIISSNDTYYYNGCYYHKDCLSACGFVECDVCGETRERDGGCEECDNHRDETLEYCYECNERGWSGEMLQTHEDGHHVCASCCDNSYTYTIVGVDYDGYAIYGYVPREEAVFRGRRNYWIQALKQFDLAWCEYCEEVYEESECPYCDAREEE